jgi:hypothetical protein
MIQGFLEIQTIEVPREFVVNTYNFFQDNGNKGYECVVLFAGEEYGNLFRVTHVIFPEQKLYKTLHGLGYSVDGVELDRINIWLYENKKTLIAQIHSHPIEAYHSEVDDDFPIVTTVGSLSIVVPDFGNSDVFFNGSAFFYLSKEGWREMNDIEIQSLFKIIE